MLAAQNAPIALTWISTVGGAIGTVGAITAVIISVWVARRDGRIRRADQADRDAAQARLVSTELRQADGRWWVRTTNDSAAPVYQCEVVEIRHPLGSRHVEPVPGAPVELRKLGPDQSLDRAVSGEGDLSDGVVVLRFLDAAGLYWRREGHAQSYRLVGGSVGRLGPP